MIQLLKGDCLELMKSIPDGSIDAIITDPPYGTTACKWDSVIDFELMWEQLNRIIKPNGAIVLFGSQPFTSALIMSNIKNYKYDWIWKKSRPTNPLLSKKQPMRYIELVSVFYKKQCNYYPIKKLRLESNKRNNTLGIVHKTETLGGANLIRTQGNSDFILPSTIIEINTSSHKKLHPTQKPVALMEYLIKTYTNENETVLDFTMGSGTTMVACQNTNRNGIGIEQDDKYFQIAKQRIKQNEYKLF